jgi:chromosome segregation ATPase
LNANKKIAELEGKIALLSQEIERLNSALEKRNNEVGNLNQRLHEIDAMNKTIGSLQEKITRLVTENADISGEMRDAQENLRLSANQNQKIMQELNEYKRKIDENNHENTVLKTKIQKLANENSSLSGEVTNAQESLRLSAATQAKLQRELNAYQEQISANNQESETYKIKIQKLLAENNSLGDEIRGAQENMRLSAGTISKLTNELKITCNENEELKRRLQDTTTVSKKLPEYENKIAMLSQEIERLNGVLDKRNSEIKGLKEGELEAENMARQVKQLSDQLKRVSGENESLYSEVRQGQEQVRLSNSAVSQLKGEVTEYSRSVEEWKRKANDLSTSKVSEYEQKIAMFSQEIERLNSVLEKKNSEITMLNKKLHDIDEMNKSIGTLQDKIKRLANENYSIEEEMRAAQENLRLSANQNAKMVKEINDYKSRIDQNDREN